MPLYDFKCKSCDEEFDDQVKLEEIEKEPNRVKCPNCGEKGHKPIISNPQHYKHGSWSKWRIGHSD